MAYAEERVPPVPGAKAPLHVHVVDEQPLVHRPDVVEDGETLLDNARLKARALCESTGVAAVADDTGLEVDALDGAPCVYSARYAGENATYADNVNKLLAELARMVNDSVSGRSYAEVADAAARSDGANRGWGRVYVDQGAAPAWIVQVPHPVADQNTERLGARVLRSAPGGVLVLAGAHRNAAEKGAADVAHRTDSVFHDVIAELIPADPINQSNLQPFALVFVGSGPEVRFGALPGAPLAIY